MDEHRYVLLIDMNSFFASVEQQCNLQLRGKPVAVGGAAGSRSVISTASYEAREFGVRSAMPVHEALRRCPNLILLSGDMRKYVDVSRRVFKICSDYTDLLEVYSIDECFLDVTHSAHLFGGPIKVAQDIKARIRADLGLTCSIGIGPNKILAKLAAGMKKPDGLTVINRGNAAGVLENLPVDELHGIGKKVSAQLAQMSITTAGALGRTPLSRLRKHFGVLGDVLHQMGNGTYDPPVVPYYDSPEVKSVGHSHTMSSNTCNMDVMCRHLLRLSEMVGRRLRERGLSGRTVTLCIRYSDMHTFTRRKTLGKYIDDGFDVFTAARAILQDQIDHKRPVRLLGVCVSNLTKGEQQLGLFADEKTKRLTEATDAINERFGEFTLRRASLIDSEHLRTPTVRIAGARREKSCEIDGEVSYG